MEKYLTATLIFLLLILSASEAFSGSTLKSITRNDEPERLQITLSFSKTPLYSVNINARRINLTLFNTEAPEDLVLPETDERLIKTLLQPEETQLTVSFFLRYAPQEAVTKPLQNGVDLTIDIMLGNPFSQQYPDLASQLLGVTVLDRDSADFTNPLQISKYAEKWSDLFKYYETPVNINPTPSLTLPPFPLASQLDPTIMTEDWLEKSIIEASQYKKWNIVQTMVQDAANTSLNESDRQKLTLTFAEALIRNGEHQEPLKILNRIDLNYPNTDLANLARLLIIYLQAKFEDPFFGFLELKKLEKKLGAKNDIRPYLNILLAETALLSNNLDEAESILKRDDVAYSGPANVLKSIRKGDLNYLRGKKTAALVLYMDAVKESDLLYSLPQSLSYYSDALYTHNHFQDAETGYSRLTSLITDKKHMDLALFRLAMSRIKIKKDKDIVPFLSQIQFSYPATEGALRARMKLADLYFISKQFPAEQITEQYLQLLQDSNDRLLKEEAAFKIALVHALTGNEQHAADLLMNQLRGFRSGNLIIEKRALLLQILPGVIQELIRKERYIEALVLAKKNRTFFTKGWIDHSVLYDLALAYTEIGAYERSATAYQYLIEISPKKEQQDVYLPLLQALYKNGHYDQVEEYARKYFSSYRSGKDHSRIFLLRLKALYEDQKLEQAAELIPSGQTEKTPELTETAANVFFGLSRHQDVIDLLESSDNQTLLQDNPRIKSNLGESYFQTGAYDKAKALFMELKDQPVGKDQSLFRLGQIHLRENNEEQALNRFQELAEKGTDPLWMKLANEQIQFMRLQSMK